MPFTNQPMNMKNQLLAILAISSFDSLQAEPALTI